MNFIHVIVLVVFSIYYTSASSLEFFATECPQLPTILIHFTCQEHEDLFSSLKMKYYESGIFTKAHLERFIRLVSNKLPGTGLITDQLAIILMIPDNLIVDAYLAAGANISPLKRIVANESNLASFYPPRGSNCPEGCPCRYYENRFAFCIEDWKESVNTVNCEYLPITISSQNVIADSVASYKALHKIPYMNPLNMFHRNIRIKFKSSQMILEIKRNTSIFYSNYFKEIIEKSGLFALNSQGFVIISEGRNSESNLDTYEAFGFYLAKAFQNSISINYKFSALITEMIKFGKIAYGNLNDLKTWNEELASSFEALLQMPEIVLNQFNFNSIDSEYPLEIVNRHSVNRFVAKKMQNFVNSKFHIQLLMIVLGFSRACPVYLLAKSKIDLNSAFLQV